MGIVVGFYEIVKATVDQTGRVDGRGQHHRLADGERGGAGESRGVFRDARTARERDRDVGGGVPHLLDGAGAADRRDGVGFGVKVLFFGAYLVAMLRGLELRPTSFVVSFAGFFIALHVIEALFLKRLFVAGAHAAPRA